MSKESLIKRFDEFASTAHPTTPALFNDNVLIVDGTNIFIRAYSVIPSMNDDGHNVGGIVGFLKTIGNFVKMYKVSRVVVVFDGKGGSQARRKIYKEYKDNRKPKHKLNRTYDFLNEQQEEDSMKWQMMKLIEILKNLPITFMAIDDVEADDVISYLANYIEKEKDGKVIIMSTDKDFLQLINNNISVFSPSKKIMYRTDNVISEFGVHPNNFLIYKILIGDESDNIDGVRGMGTKTINKLFPEFHNEQKINIDDLLILAAKYPKFKSATLITQSKQLLERNRELMNLQEVKMNTNSKILVMDKFDKHNLVFNKVALTKIFVEAKFINAFPNYNEWLNGAFFPLMRFSI